MERGEGVLGEDGGGEGVREDMVEEIDEGGEDDWLLWILVVPLVLGVTTGWVEDLGMWLREWVKVGLGERIGGFPVVVDTGTDGGLAAVSHSGIPFSFLMVELWLLPYEEILKAGGDGGNETEEFDESEDKDDDDADDDKDSLELPIPDDTRDGAPFDTGVVLLDGVPGEGCTGGLFDGNLHWRDSASSMACICPSISTVASCKDLTTASRAGSRS